MRYKLSAVNGDEALSLTKRIGVLTPSMSDDRPSTSMRVPAFVDGGATVPEYAIDGLMQPISAPELDLGIHLATDVILTGRRFLVLNKRWVVWNRLEGQALRVPEPTEDTGIAVDDSGQIFLNYDERDIDVFSGHHVLLFWDAAYMYHHWMFECAPRILLALQSECLADFNFVFPIDRPAFVDQTLDLLGVPVARRVYFDPRRLVLFESLALAPVPVFERSSCSSSVLRELRRALLQNVGSDNQDRPRRVFFTRRDALRSERILINELDIIKTLQVVGFTAIELGELSVAEQIKITHAAETIVYIHGSAGANLIFVKPDANVLHVFPDCVSFFVSHGIGTAVVGAQYAYIFGPSFQRSIRHHNNPWLVSPDRILTAVTRLESG